MSLRLLTVLLAVLGLAVPAGARAQGTSCPDGALSLGDVTGRLEFAHAQINRGEWPEARLSLAELEAALPCAGEPLPASVLARLWYLRGLADLCVNLLTADEGSAVTPRVVEALTWARSLDPELSGADLIGMGMETAWRSAGAEPDRQDVHLRVDAAVDTVWIDGVRLSPGAPAPPLFAGPHLVQVRSLPRGRLASTLWTPGAAPPLGLVRDAQALRVDGLVVASADGSGAPGPGHRPDGAVELDAPGETAPGRLSLGAGARMWTLPQTFVGPEVLAGIPLPGPLRLTVGAGAALGGWALGPCDDCLSDPRVHAVVPLRADLAASWTPGRAALGVGLAWASIAGGGFGSCEEVYAELGESADCSASPSRAALASFEHVAGVVLRGGLDVGPMELGLDALLGLAVWPRTASAPVLSVGVTATR